MKQHLALIHAEPDFYCDRCKAIFEDKNQHDRHLQQDKTCNFKEWDSGDQFVTRPQQKQLSKRSTGNSEAENRFAVWRILFPGHPEPRSPYIDLDIPEGLRAFQEYATAGLGRMFLLEELRRAGFRNPVASLPEETLETCTLSAVGRAIDSLLENFASSLPPPDRSGARSSGNRGSLRPEVSRPRTTPSSFADSGLALSSHRAQRSGQQDSLFFVGSVNPESQLFPGQNQGLPDFDPGAHGIATTSQTLQRSDHIDNTAAFFPIFTTGQDVAAADDCFDNQTDLFHGLEEPGNSPGLELDAEFPYWEQGQSSTVDDLNTWPPIEFQPPG